MKEQRDNRECGGWGALSVSSLLIQKHTTAGSVLGTFLSQHRTVSCSFPPPSPACLVSKAHELLFHCLSAAWGSFPLGNRLGTGGPAWSTPSPSAAVFMVGCVYEELSGFNPTKSQNFPWELLCSTPPPGGGLDKLNLSRQTLWAASGGLQLPPEGRNRSKWLWRSPDTWIKIKQYLLVD